MVFLQGASTSSVSSTTNWYSSMVHLLKEHDTLKILLVDDFPTTLDGTKVNLQRRYPDAQVFVSETALDAFRKLEEHQPNLLVLDLSIPDVLGERPREKNGIRFLKSVMVALPSQNIAILSSNIQSLVRIRPEIDSHRGGFTITDKSSSTYDMLERVDAALRGYSDTREIKGFQPGTELKPEWLEVLNLAFHEGLQDKAIAEKMHVQTSTIRHYWKKLCDVLEIYSDVERKDGKNLRTRIEILAKEKGLLDR